MILEEEKVTFFDAIKHFWKGYFDFRGRSKRSGYWWAVLFNFLVFIIIPFIGGALMINSTSKLTLIMIKIGVVITSLIFSLSIIIPKLMLTFRRWRDAGLNNNGILIYFLLLLCLNTISMYYNTFGMIMLSISYIISFVLCLLPSDKLTTNSNNSILKFLFRKQ